MNKIINYLVITLIPAMFIAGYIIGKQIEINSKDKTTFQNQIDQIKDIGSFYNSWSEYDRLQSESVNVFALDFYVNKNLGLSDYLAYRQAKFLFEAHIICTSNPSVLDQIRKNGKTSNIYLIANDYSKHKITKEQPFCSPALLEGVNEFLKSLEIN